jgi:hypothetical protein
MNISSIDIEKDGLAQLLGGDKFSHISRSTRSKIERLASEFQDLVDPSLFHQHTEIRSVQEDIVQLEEGPSLKSSKLSKTLQHCNKVVSFIATSGKAVDNEIKRLMDEKQLSEAYILDAMASIATDNMVGTFHQQMKDEYKEQDKQVTLCFSPGYCDWPITDQKKLFGMFEQSDLNVELTDSCFMKPRKSISGIFGITPPGADPSAQTYNPCSECNRRDCSARRM